MENLLSEDVEKVGQQDYNLYARLTFDLSKDYSSDEIQDIVGGIVTLIQKHAGEATLEERFWNSSTHTYSNEFVKNITDTKYDEGASEYIAKAFKYYVKMHFELKLHL